MEILNSMPDLEAKKKLKAQQAFFFLRETVGLRPAVAQQAFSLRWTKRFKMFSFFCVLCPVEISRKLIYSLDLNYFHRFD
jgi:hypothetical protein